ncbi:GGDEF domain-containing protein [Thalassospira lucentensis]|uniref:GGDEF domain-containing protein n=1 Tax=Thalassospira lucentensis TaxID=168935 RepID=UPI00399D761B
MKVTRPPSTIPSMGAGDGRYSSNQYSAFAYGKDAVRRRSSMHQHHEVDIDTGNLPDAVDDQPFHTPDMANVLGIPDSQVTPAVEQAIGRLMVRINGLSENLSDLKKHQAYLARSEGRDPFTGAMSRPAFMQILENEMAVQGTDRTMRMLLVCELSNIDEILQRHGQECKDGLFKYVHQIMADFIMSPHHLGYLGCNDFAALLYNVDKDDTRLRIDAVIRQINQSPFSHKGKFIAVKPVFGIYQARNGDTATSALNAADFALRAEKEMRLAQLERIPFGI